jgi:MFS family permease
MANEQNGGFIKLPRLSTIQLINLCVGIIGIQFAWSMQIALSSRVLEPLGADPFLYGFIWCAGPVTGLLIQPIVGAISDRTWTKIGRRRPFLLTGAILGGLALLFFPLAPTLLLAAIMIWIIDACVNISQGPYRALVPDVTPPEQHAVANSYLNFAFGVGSVIALGVAPLLRMFDIQMTVTQQYFMAAIALVLMIVYTSLTIKEYSKKSTKPAESAEEPVKQKPPVPMGQLMKDIFIGPFKTFFKVNREIHKICGVQFLTWMGIMCMFIYLTPYTVHNIYKLPDLSTKEYKQKEVIYSTFTNLRNDLDAKEDLLLTANGMVGDMLQNAGLTDVNYAVVFPEMAKTMKQPEAIQFLAAMKVEKQKYVDMNNRLDIILSDFAGSSKKYKNDVLPVIEDLTNKMTPAVSVPAKLVKFDKAFKTEFDGLLYQKGMAEVKLLVIQYPLFLNQKLLKEIKFVKPNKQVEKELIPLAAKMKALNERVEEHVDYGKEDKLSFSGDVIDNFTTFPGTVAKFYEIHTMAQMKKLDLEATNTAQKALVAFNLMPLIFSIPLGYLCNRVGKKPIYSITLGFLAVAFFFAPFIDTAWGVILMMTGAGIAWATILSIPFAFLCDYIPEGEEGSIMGIFNMFIAGPQLISALVVSKVILMSPMETALGMSHNWSIAFVVASVSVFFAIIALQFVKEKRHGLDSSCQISGGGH